MITLTLLRRWRHKNLNGAHLDKAKIANERVKEKKSRRTRAQSPEFIEKKSSFSTKISRDNFQVTIYSKIRVIHG